MHNNQHNYSKKINTLLIWWLMPTKCSIKMVIEKIGQIRIVEQCMRHIILKR